MSYLVKTPEDRFSRNKAHLMLPFLYTPLISDLGSGDRELQDVSEQRFNSGQLEPKSSMEHAS